MTSDGLQKKICSAVSQNANTRTDNILGGSIWSDLGWSDDRILRSSPASCWLVFFLDSAFALTLGLRDRFLNKPNKTATYGLVPCKGWQNFIDRHPHLEISNILLELRAKSSEKRDRLLSRWQYRRMRRKTGEEGGRGMRMRTVLTC